MKKFGAYIKSHAKLILTIVPVFLAILILFFTLTGRKIVELSKGRLELEAQNCVTEINGWAGQVLSELNIYKDIVDVMGIDNGKTFELLADSSGQHQSYPYGLYWGDIHGSYFDASGWVPDEDYVPSERNWYIEGLEHEEFAFGDAYVDVMTGGTCVSVTARTGEGDRESVLAADVYPDYASQLVAEVVEGDVELAFFASEAQLVIACSDPSMVGASLGDREMPELYNNIGRILSQGRNGLQTTWGEGGRYYIYIEKVESAKWYFVSCMKEWDVLSDLFQVAVPMLLASAAAVALMILVTFRAAREISIASRKARTDPLTKLLNRDGFRELVLTALETRPNQGVLLLLDMDNFKLVNDQLGHPEGDVVLRKMAALLEKYFNRNKDITARIGGDEFAVFVGRVITERETEIMLKKFIEFFHGTFDSQYAEQRLSVSVGATFVEEGVGYEELYKRVDKALYKVKGDGKDGYGF